MKNNQNYAAKIDGYAKIISLLSSNDQILKRVSRFQLATDQLISNQKKLMVLYPQLSKDITATEKAKNKRRAVLIDKNLPVIRILQAFAFDKKKKNLQNRLDYLTLDYLKNCSDKELMKISKKTWQLATKYSGYATTYVDKIKSTINPDESKAITKFKNQYGLKPEMIKAIENSNIKFIESVLLYQQGMKEKEKVAMQMKKVNKQTSNLLSKKIDRFVLLFEKESPHFYLEYRTLREKSAVEESNEDSIQVAKPEKELIAEEHNEMA
ncbi:MAG: hypothetical protein H7X84_08770 [Verrucomicrobia bacterium]|nr:hypothetical protein [Prolixibacteraceae bacterium]